MEYKPTSLNLSEYELTALEVIFNAGSGCPWRDETLASMATRLLWPPECGLQLNQPVVRQLRQKRLLESGRLYEKTDWGDGVQTETLNPMKVPFRVTALGLQMIREADIPDYAFYGECIE